MATPHTLDSLTVDSIPSLSFEDASAFLSTIVQRMQEGSLSLATLTQFYTLGLALEAHCRKLLEDARVVLTTIARTPDGEGI